MTDIILWPVTDSNVVILRDPSAFIVQTTISGGGGGGRSWRTTRIDIDRIRRESQRKRKIRQTNDAIMAIIMGFVSIQE